MVTTEATRTEATTPMVLSPCPPPPKPINITQASEAVVSDVPYYPRGKHKAKGRNRGDTRSVFI